MKPRKAKEHPELEKDDKKQKQYFYEAREHHLEVHRMDEVEDNYMVLADETPSERRYAWPEE
jgi:hypothetical protein